MFQAGQYFQNDIEEINRRIDIVKLAESYNLELIQVTPKKYKTYCVFHQEDTPSLFLFQDNDNGIDSYHCFGCGATGAGIWFIKGYEKISFPLAIEKAKYFVGYTTKTFNNSIEEIVYLLNNQSNKSNIKKSEETYFYYLSIALRDFLKKNVSKIEWVDEQFKEIDEFYKQNKTIDEWEIFFNNKLKLSHEV
jgi:DNA primase